MSAGAPGTGRRSAASAIAGWRGRSRGRTRARARVRAGAWGIELRRVLARRRTGRRHVRARAARAARAAVVRRGRGNRVGTAPARRRLERILRLWEVAAVAAVGGLHVGPPEGPGRRPAVAREVAREGVSDPDRGGKARRVADEPGVGLAL